jgi:inositol hexakisphosphate/diphosphoinositol-pentakisphosphate kinase
VQVHEDHLELNGVKISKPFVEKPVSAEDHNINIYYADADGGGSKRLFRKEKNQSSAFYPNESAIRTDGAFIYEQFLPTEGTDLKVCRESAKT